MVSCILANYYWCIDLAIYCRYIILCNHERVGRETILSSRSSSIQKLVRTRRNVRNITDPITSFYKANELGFVQSFYKEFS